MIRLVRWMCDPARREAIEGDLAELYGEHWSWRCAIDVLSVCARQPRTVVRSLAATLVVLVVLGPAAGPLRYTIHGADFRIALTPQGGIAWYPRRSVSH